MEKTNLLRIKKYIFIPFLRAPILVINNGQMPHVSIIILFIDITRLFLNCYWWAYSKSHYYWWTNDSYDLATHCTQWVPSDLDTLPPPYTLVLFCSTFILLVDCIFGEERRRIERKKNTNRGKQRRRKEKDENKQIGDFILMRIWINTET